jgi:2-amino-4-hydroxy-6-hydroxymethyldihydropteridine diphosphokinase
MSDTVVRAALGLGSNLGDRRRFLDDALTTIGSAPGIDVVAVSPVVETEPVGGPEQPEYLNVVAVLDTSLTPDDLLDLAQRCERDAGRVRDVRWGPRTLDVDVLAYDDVEVESPTLTLPHPRATERAFVMVPWAVVDPGFVVSGRRVAEWAHLLGGSGVRTVEGTG